MSKKEKYDLVERTAMLGETVISFVRGIEKNEITRPLISQIVRSSASIGANYMEADGAESKKDFRHKISICKKEAMETRHWLRMIAAALPERKEECRSLWREAQELTLILATIIKNSEKKKEE
jgi:four helix bundle protein